MVSRWRLTVQRHVDCLGYVVVVVCVCVFVDVKVFVQLMMAMKMFLGITTGRDKGRKCGQTRLLNDECCGASSHSVCLTFNSRHWSAEEL